MAVEGEKGEALIQWLNKVSRWLQKGEVLGAIAGVVFGFMVMKYGFFWTLFICVCGFVGYKIGKRIDSEEFDIRGIIDRYFPSGRR
ncbi:MAG: DUF2273 domain-containing protein [Bacillota bacterium]